MNTPKRMQLRHPAKAQGNRTQFAICVDNAEYPASLERWKIYQVRPDREATRHGQIRVIDESGEDYLYPAESFRLVELPAPLRKLYPGAVA